ncbi:unnamed protein product, partial [Diamesa tonsa]
ILGRASANVSEPNIRNWFDYFENYLKEDGNYEIMQDLSRIFNANETGFQLNPLPKKVLAKRG